jgi:hypothetical protein
VSDLFDRVLRLIRAGAYEYSEHAVRKLVKEEILIERLIETAAAAIVVEVYPNYHAGPCVLCLQFDESDRPIHLLWEFQNVRPGQRLW